MTESFEELFRALHQFKKLNVVSMLPDELTKSFRPSPRLKLQKIREKWKSKTVWFVSNMSTSDIRRITMKDLRDEIGFVPQKGVLFSGTIASNLRFGKDDASDEEIAKAAEIAQATEFIEAKDDKYETPIAQGGSNVSGGQKQRLAIARAILADNKILILVMKDGDIIEQGNHEELLAANGFYANLYNSQFEDVVA